MNKNYCLPIASIAILTILPLFIPGFFYGDDYMFMGIICILVNGIVWAYSLGNIYHSDPDIYTINLFVRKLLEVIVFVLGFVAGIIAQFIIYGRISGSF